MSKQDSLWPSRWNRTAAQWRSWMRRYATTEIKLSDDAGTYRFLCSSKLEEMRAHSLFVKEAGTIEWMRTQVRTGEVFCDIGANIGLYSIYAARRVGATGRVFAFEPHPGNAASLLQNISINKLADRITVLSCALHDQEGMFDFNIRSLESGGAMSQLGTTIDADGNSFRPAASELKYACSLDRLIARGDVSPPHHVKIDVDGNEPLVLDGMRGLLAGTQRPRTIQVEVNHSDGPNLERRLSQFGYVLDNRHFTHHGKQMLARGVSVENIPHNVVYRSRTAA